MPNIEIIPFQPHWLEEFSNIGSSLRAASSDKIFIAFEACLQMRVIAVEFRIFLIAQRLERIA